MSGPPAVPAVTRLLDQDRVNAYAEVGSDRNPIHLDPDFARRNGFDSSIAHGMLVLSLVSEAMSAALGKRWVNGGALKIRWRAPALIPVTVTARAELRSESDGVATYDVTCEDERGTVLLTGTASVAYR